MGTEPSAGPNGSPSTPPASQNVTAPTAAYPAEWAGDVALTDGEVVQIRPVRPGDAAAVLSLFERTSPDALYLRFFSYRRVTPAYVDRIVNVDYVDRVALVVESRGELIGLGSYDRLPGTSDAEMALLVEDRHHGRGVGTLLLEQLAAAARERGIARFTAEVLPQNKSMLGVFRDLGFVVRSHRAQGEVDLAFDLAPGPQYAAQIDLRARRAEARSVARLLAPRSVAVIGAGRQRGNLGNEIFRNLLDGGFNGPVYPVHPQALHIGGVRAYPSVLDVPDPVDLAVVAVPAARVVEVAEQCAAKGVHGLVVVSAGFAEAGSDTLDAQRRLVGLARRAGMRIIGPNCLGVVNTAPDVRMHGLFVRVRADPGRVAFGSQSGGLGLAVLERATRMGLGISTFVSLGNKADVSGNDLLQYWEEDDATDLVLLYLESFGNPAKFVRIARRVSKRKPILAVKSGRSTAGLLAASSHTAALASPDVAVDALFRQAGVVRVDTLEQLFDLALLLAHQAPPRGRRVAIVGNSGGPAVLAADACEREGLLVPALSEATQRHLLSILPAGAAVRNPVDMLAAASADDYQVVLGSVLADDAIDAAIVIHAQALESYPEVLDRIATTAATGRRKTVLVTLLSAGGQVQDRGLLPAGGVPFYAFPESAALALARAAAYAEWKGRPEGTIPALQNIDTEGARAIVHAAMRDAPLWLPPPVAADLVARYGIPIASVRPVETPTAAAAMAAEVGFPVALKAASPSLIHKSDVGGVRLGLSSEEEVRAAFVEMSQALGEAMGGAVVQAMVTGGGSAVEVLAGVVRDPAFGPLIAFGLGGVNVEVFRDQAFRLVPLTDLDARDLVRSTRGSRLLLGYRGRPPVDVAALEDLLLRVARLAEDLPEVAELDLNPIIATPQGALAVDVKLRLAPPPPRPDLTQRRLPPVR